MSILYTVGPADVKFRKEHIVEFVFVGCILGYPLVAGVTAALDFANREVSIGLRAMIGLAAVFLIIDGIGRPRTAQCKWLIVLLSVFFCTYLARIIASTLFQPQRLLEDPAHYWIWTVGAALLPSFGLAISRPRALDLVAWHRRFLLFGILASVLVMTHLTTYVGHGLDAYDSGRAQLETLNPISLGYLGGSVFLTALAALMVGLKSQLGLRLIPIIGIIVGFTLIIAANSRGPIVASATALMFGWLALRGGRRFVLTAIGVVLIVSFIPLLAAFEDQFGITTYSRLVAQPFSQEQTVVLRIAIYQTALDTTLQNILLGAGLEIAETGTYPHNLTIEAFLATGIIGGSAFLILQLAVLIAMWRICKRNSQAIWLGMLVVQYLVANQFSGAIYASNQYWAAIGIAILMGSVLPRHRKAQSLPDLLKAHPA